MESHKSGWVFVGLGFHPTDGEGGRVYLAPAGRLVLVTCNGSIRSLPRRFKPAVPRGLAMLEACCAPSMPRG